MPRETTDKVVIVILWIFSTPRNPQNIGSRFPYCNPYLGISEYLSKYQQYGPDTVLCCRGHRFFTHALNEENPEECWVDYENLRFFDETKEDMKVCLLYCIVLNCTVLYCPY